MLLKPLIIAGKQYTGNLVLAPMAGVTDIVMRNIAKQNGADYAIGEMSHSDKAFINTNKTKNRGVSLNEIGNKTVQILGTCPYTLAEAAKKYQDDGADVIDLNLGCPQKKVFNKKAGSSLLQDLELVKRIINTVINKVKIPVTVKARTGISRNHNIALELLKICEDAGVAALTIHGRSKEDLFKGKAEFDTVRQLKEKAKIPIIANGDINNANFAKKVIKNSNIDAIMIGRAACGNPWIFNRIKSQLGLRNTKKYQEKYKNDDKTNTIFQEPSYVEIINTMIQHLLGLENIYPNHAFKIFRKHFAWYLQKQFLKLQFNKPCNRMNSSVPFTIKELSNFRLSANRTKNLKEQERILQQMIKRVSS